MRVAIYARYSSDRQNERSIADQEEACRRHAAARGWTVTASFSDAAISGATMANRPGLLALLASAEAGTFDLVLVEDQDRLARNLEHEAHVYNRLRHLGVHIATLTTDRVQIIDVAFKGLMNELYLVNLGQKTSRGMRANAERGLATGSRLYGYRSHPGGAIEIVPAEAAVIVKIFELYVDGYTVREVAERLNRDGVPGPRGGYWNASSINGSRQRANGILRTELYAGVKVFGRLDMRKDPTTGRRTPVMRPADQWRRTDAPHLRIVSEPLWTAAQERLSATGQGRAATAAARRPGVFSGLVKCGECGASYTVYNDGRLVCSGYREKGPSFCANRRLVRRSVLEETALTGLREQLLSSEAVAAYVRAYHRAWAQRRADSSGREDGLRSKLAEIARRADRLVDAIAEGVATREMKAKLLSLSAEREEVERELAAIEAAAEPPIELHPNAADAYKDYVGELQANLAQASKAETPADRRLIQCARALVDRIEIHPKGQAKTAPIEAVVYGTLSQALRREPTETGSRWAVVAGGGIEPPTCGL